MASNHTAVLMRFNCSILFKPSFSSINSIVSTHLILSNRNLIYFCLLFRRKPVSEEEKVTDVLAKVESGEADAGVVYVTDVEAAGDQVTGIDFPEASQAVNVYPIATVKDSDQADLAQQFVDLVLSDAGQKVLHDAGFAPAP